MKRTESTSSAQVLKKTQPEEFDLVIPGGGTGSTIAAWTFAGEGKRVAVVERKYIGGSCPNIACLPSKNIIHSAKVASYFRRSKEFGITHDGFAIDMADVRERRMVRGLSDMYMENYRSLRCRCGGDPGRRPDCDDRRAALHRAARCGPDSPNTGRRSHTFVLIRGVRAQRCRDERSPDLRRMR
jgi:Pyridine nucleotide-disulphide oxidoreductase